MKILSENIKSILSVIIVVTCIAYFFMCSIRNIKPDPQILIAMVSIVSSVTGYHFGSSSSSNSKPTVQQAETVTIDQTKS